MVLDRLDTSTLNVPIFIDENHYVIKGTSASDWISIDTCVEDIFSSKIRELELRIECLENKLKQQKQENKYKIVLGE